MKRITPALVIRTDVDIAWATYEATREAAWTTYRQAWTHNNEAVETTREASRAEKGALKIATTAIHQIKTTRSKERAEAIRETVKAVVLDTRAKKAPTQQAEAADDHTVETATGATDASKTTKLKAIRLEEKFINHQHHNLGVLHGCDALAMRLQGIRVVEKITSTFKS